MGDMLEQHTRIHTYIEGQEEERKYVYKTMCYRGFLPSLVHQKYIIRI